MGINEVLCLRTEGGFGVHCVFCMCRSVIEVDFVQTKSTACEEQSLLSHEAKMLPHD